VARDSRGKIDPETTLVDSGLNPSVAVDGPALTPDTRYSTLASLGEPMPNDTHSLIQLNGLSKVFSTEEVETHALSSIKMEIRTGESVSIAGPSGCGIRKQSVEHRAASTDATNSLESSLSGSTMDPDRIPPRTPRRIDVK
jgi:hypothetical protein